MVRFDTKYGRQSVILDNINMSKCPDETRPKSSLIMYFKQKCYLLQVSSSSAEYVSRVVNMASISHFGQYRNFKESTLN